MSLEKPEGPIKAHRSPPPAHHVNLDCRAGAPREPPFGAHRYEDVAAGHASRQADCLHQGDVGRQLAAERKRRRRREEALAETAALRERARRARPEAHRPHAAERARRCQLAGGSAEAGRLAAAAAGRDAADPGPEGRRAVRRAGVGRREDDPVARGDARSDRAAERAEELERDAAVAEVGVETRDDHVAAGAAQLPVGRSAAAARGDDDPRAGQGDADGETLALVAGAGGRADPAHAGGGCDDDGAESGPHAGNLRNHSSDSTAARSARTPPAAAITTVTSRSSFCFPSRDPSSSYTFLSPSRLVASNAAAPVSCAISRSVDGSGGTVILSTAAPGSVRTTTTVGVPSATV